MNDKRIELLDDKTIDKIAAGEVIERPSSVVKELLENAIDAGADAVTVEIKEGGINFIRVTDNGEGIEKSQVPIAFYRHATSKIKTIEDLFRIESLGFRGEALSSIAAVGQVELITKVKDSLTGVRYVIEGTKERIFEDIGAPEGTTFVVRNLFFNTPVRRKFLKTPTTEASYITELIEKLALSHPDISIKYILNGNIKLQTSGNGQIKDIIYQIYGRDVTDRLIPIESETETVSIKGFIGAPEIVRSNRNFELYFVNGRFIRSDIITRAIEDAFKPYTMQHKYPFTVLYLHIHPDQIDINVHPNKLEIKFMESEPLYRMIVEKISHTLQKRELIPTDVNEVSQKEPVTYSYEKASPEPFEQKRKEQEIQFEKVLKEKSEYQVNPIPIQEVMQNPILSKVLIQEDEEEKEILKDPVHNVIKVKDQIIVERATQLDLFDEPFLAKDSIADHQMLGQIFDTYWLVSFSDKLFIIDQHAAHEKVLYERLLSQLKDHKCVSQSLNPPMIVSLSKHEEELMQIYQDSFFNIGFEIEPFGGNEYAIRAVPADLFGMNEKELFREIMDSLSTEVPKGEPDVILQKLASMACKGAVKGNHTMSEKEASSLIEELLKLEHPYHCPHGRPTIIAFTKYEIEKRFKRIV